MMVMQVVQQWDSTKIVNPFLSLEKKNYKVCLINKKQYIKFQKIEKHKKSHLKKNRIGSHQKIFLREISLNYLEKIDIDINIDFNLLDFSILFYFIVLSLNS